MRFYKCFAIGTLAAAAVFANADLFIEAGPGNFEGDENILFNEPGLVGTGNPVEGITNQTGFIVDFLSDETLTTPSGGQARIEALDGAFDNMSIFLDNDPDAGYTSLILNINALDFGTVTFDIDQRVGSNLVATFDLDPNGENFFRIWSTNGQFIVNTTFTSTVDISDIRQVRIGGSTTEIPPEEVVPEPGTIGVACCALGLAYMRRKKARKV